MTTILNYTEGQKAPDNFFMELIEELRSRGWGNFIVHRLREDHACESQVVLTPTDNIKNPHMVMLGTVMEAMILTYAQDTGMEVPTPHGSDEYEDWLKKNILVLVLALLQKR